MFRVKDAQSGHITTVDRNVKMCRHLTVKDALSARLVYAIDKNVVMCSVGFSVFRVKYARLGHITTVDRSVKMHTLLFE